MWESILSDSIGLFGPRLSSDLGALGIFLGHVSARFFMNLNCFISNFSNCTNFQKNLSNWFPKYFTWMIDLKYFISPSSWFQICKTCILYIHVRPNVVVLNWALQLASNIPPVGQKLHQSVLWQVHTDRIPGGAGRTLSYDEKAPIATQRILFILRSMLRYSLMGDILHKVLRKCSNHIFSLTWSPHSSVVGSSKNKKFYSVFWRIESRTWITWWFEALSIPKG